ncbi:hypothetical protein JCM10212_001196 [Sporobolomyces blumeae]
MYEIGWQIGGLVGFWINLGCKLHVKNPHAQWLVPFAVQFIPGGIFAAGIPFFIKESPRWLMVAGRREEAIKNLCIIRGLDRDDPYIINEMNEIDVQVEPDRTAIGTGFFAPFKQVFGKGSLFRRMLITTSLFIWQNGTGINAINYYSPTFFKSIGVSGGLTSLLTTGIFGVIKTVLALVWCFFVIDRFGRRGILLVGSVGGAISMYIIGGYLAAANIATTPSRLPPSPWSCRMVRHFPSERCDRGCWLRLSGCSRSIARPAGRSDSLSTITRPIRVDDKCERDMAMTGFRGEQQGEGIQ